MNRDEFQFYDSPIKSSGRATSTAHTAKFQFYDSPIKSGYKTAIVAFDPFSFNSMIVRLKAVYARQG